LQSNSFLINQNTKKQTEKNDEVEIIQGNKSSKQQEL